MACARLIVLVCLSSFIFAEQIEISANSFYANEKSGQNVLSGNVRVKKDKDKLSSDKLDVLVDKNRQPIKYVATGNAQFEVVLNEKLYKGSADKLSYDAQKDIYEMSGNAYIEEPTSNKKIYGDLIIVDKRQNIYRVQSKENKPARFIFELETK